MVKLIIFGAGGRMGSKILELALKDGNFEILGALESREHPLVGKRILDGKVAVASDVSLLKASDAIAVDFTAPSATLSHLKILAGWNNAAAVIGTTGFSAKEESTIKDFSRNMPIVFSSNMSRGVNLLFKLVRQVARALSDYDIEIIEAHHSQKKDAPSGTALSLANEIAQELQLNGQKEFIYGRQGAVGKRTKKEIGIHAVRAGDIVGEHTVIFAAGGERVELRHLASSRDAFANGALYAARWLSGKKPGLYSMQDVLAE